MLYVAQIIILKGNLNQSATRMEQTVRFGSVDRLRRTGLFNPPNWITADIVDGGGSTISFPSGVSVCGRIVRGIAAIVN